MSVKQKYLRDENGEIFSPIVSASSVYLSNGSPIQPIVLFEASGGISTGLKFDGSIKTVSDLTPYIGRTIRVSVAYWLDEFPQTRTFRITKANSDGHMVMFLNYVRDYNGAGDIWEALLRIQTTGSSWELTLSSLKLLTASNTIDEHKDISSLNQRFYISKIEII